MILILTNKWDISTDFVIRELRNRKHPFIRLNTEDLVQDGTNILLPELKILVKKNGQIYDLKDSVGVIWNRRPGKPYDDIENNKRPSKAIQAFVNEQWHSLYEGLQLINECVWINHPRKNDIAESKIFQLNLANNLGFNIPETLISNDPDKIIEFKKKFGDEIIAKALYSPLIEETEQDYFIFTNLVKNLSLDGITELKQSPIIFQQPLIPKIDYRVTVVGDTVFTAKILSFGDKGLDHDWRIINRDIKFIPDNLPLQIENLCMAFVKNAGLLFGAIDLVVHNDEFYFLEINPNGEWGWLQKPVGLSIAEKLSDLMISFDNDKNPK